VSSVAGSAAGDPDPAKLAQALRERLTADRAREVERGLTLSGPHRDDLALAVRGLPARTHASHGEAWSLALALRLGAHQLLTEEGEEPVLLLDDVFAELDRQRRDRVAEAALAAEQTIVTAAVAEELPPALGATVFHVEPGSVQLSGGPPHKPGSPAGGSGPAGRDHPVEGGSGSHRSGTEDGGPVEGAADPDRSGAQDREPGA
jgi:recombinational DNA repair ATPase RecF